MNEIFARDLNGVIVSPSDQGYDELINSIWDTMKTATELNNGYHTPDESAGYWEKSSGRKWMSP